MPFLGFNYEFNSLTSSDELAEAYAYLMNFPPKGLRIFLRSLSNRFPSVRKLPINEYKRFNNECKVIDQVSEKLVKEKYLEEKDNKLNGKDLLSLLINANRNLPIEEKLTDDELKYQVIKQIFETYYYYKMIIKCILIYYLLYFRL